MEWSKVKHCLTTLAASAVKRRHICLSVQVCKMLRTIWCRLISSHDFSNLQMCVPICIYTGCSLQPFTSNKCLLFVPTCKALSTLIFFLVFEGRMMFLPLRECVCVSLCVKVSNMKRAYFIQTYRTYLQDVHLYLIHIIRWLPAKMIWGGITQYQLFEFYIMLWCHALIKNTFRRLLWLIHACLTNHH